jgi:hypothetical protein
MRIIFLFLLFSLLPLYSADKNSFNRKAKISEWLQELNKKKSVNEQYSFAFSGKQIRCTDNERAIKTHGDPQRYLSLALENLAKEYQNVVSIKNKLKSKQKKFADEKKQHANKFLILRKLQRSHKNRLDNTVNDRITFFQVLIKKFENEKCLFESFKDKKNFSERNIVQIFRFLPGYFYSKLGCKINIFVGGAEESLQGKEEIKILWCHQLYYSYMLAKCVCFTSNSKSKLPWFCPRYVHKNTIYHQSYGPWFLFLDQRSDPWDIIPNILTGDSFYKSDADPRVKRLPLCATEEQKRAAIYENPFAKKYGWIFMKALVNAEPE